MDESDLDAMTELAGRLGSKIAKTSMWWLGRSPKKDKQEKTLAVGSKMMTLPTVCVRKTHQKAGVRPKAREVG